ncbi:MAG: agmatine deiminase family protein [Saprospiraceae bacterium]|nr:agmatine deiminase family protein [Saprospiraceae bacterium]
MKKILYLLCSLLAFSQTAFAQNDPLPRGFSVEELGWLSANKPAPGTLSGITTPPPAPVRAAAEWEEMQAIVVTWTSFKPILAQIVNAAKNECRVLVITNDIATCQSELSGYGVDWQTGGNVEFKVAPYNSIWIRDYGANPIYLNGVDSLALVDWIYNRPRPKDDTIPSVVGAYFGYPVYSTTVAPYDLAHPGGNNFSDGMGTNFSSKLVLEENGINNMWGTSNHTEEGVDSIMRRFYGIDRYVKFDVLPYDGIHHIDMHMKLLNEETLLVGEYPEGVIDRDQIEANIQYLLANYTTPFGTTYKVVRIAMPPDGGVYPSQGAPLRTFVNSFIVNKTVLLPQYEVQYDTTAIRIWQKNMPGYNIVGINCNAIIPLGGAIHCIVKEVGVADPLLIQHKQVESFVDTNPPAYEVKTWIRHRSGIAGAEVFYTTDTASGYQSVPMTLTDPTTHLWTGWIPQQPYGSTVRYYLHATANSGKQQVRPLPAPEGFFDFNIRLSVGTDEATGAPQLLRIFPNPAGAITCVPVFSENGASASIEITDILGRTVASVFNGTLPAGESKYFFRADLLEPGTYFVTLHGPQGRQVQKVFVRR